MKKSILLVVAALVGACSTDSTEAGVAKVEVANPDDVLDPDGDGEVQATVEEKVAVMALELAEPLPEISGPRSSDDPALLDIVDAMFVTVSSPRSLASVSLEDGIYVTETPDEPGEWTATLSDDRMTIGLKWFNETPSGLTMTPGQSYDVVFELGDNCCITAVPPTTRKFSL
jgi:hypothetical protein